MFFCPSTTILFCVYTCLILIFLCLTLAFFLRSYLTVELLSIFTLKDLLFAMITGVTASALVSICVEGASNYRQSCKRFIMLSDYLSIIFHYEPEIQSYLKVYREDEMISKKPDRLQAVFYRLPKLIPVLQNTINNKREYLTTQEICEIQNVLKTYERIESIICEHLMHQAKFTKGTKRPKNVSQNVWDSLPASWQTQLSFEERYEEIRQLAKRICQLGIFQFGNQEIPVGAIYLDYTSLKDEMDEGDRNFYLDNKDPDLVQEEEGNDKDESTKLFESEMLSLSCLEIDQYMQRILKLAKNEPGWWIYARIMEEIPPL